MGVCHRHSGLFCDVLCLRLQVLLLAVGREKKGLNYAPSDYVITLRFKGKAMWTIISNLITFAKREMVGVITLRGKAIAAAVANESETRGAIEAAKIILNGLSMHAECGPVFLLAVEGLDHLLAAETTPDSGTAATTG